MSKLTRTATGILTPRSDRESALLWLAGGYKMVATLTPDMAAALRDLLLDEGGLAEALSNTAIQDMLMELARAVVTLTEAQRELLEAEGQMKGSEARRVYVGKARGMVERAARELGELAGKGMRSEE